MATTQFAFCSVNTDADLAAFRAGATFEIKAPTGTSAATTAAALATQGFCRVATDTAVYVTFAASPTASASAGFMVPANTVAFFRIQSGDKGAVITV